MNVWIILPILVFIAGLITCIYLNFMAVETYRSYLKYIGKKTKINIFTYQNITLKTIPPSEDLKIMEYRARFKFYNRLYMGIILGGFICFGVTLLFLKLTEE